MNYLNYRKKTDKPTPKENSLQFDRKNKWVNIPPGCVSFEVRNTST